MNISQIKELKNTLENNIRLKCEQELYDFYGKTGLTPSSININLIDVTKLGSRSRTYMVGQVNAVLEI